MSAVLVISPHPDDEAIGCGGTLRKHALAGDDVSVVFVTSGEAGGHGRDDPGTLREAEAVRAASVLGVRETEFWRAPDGRVRAGASETERLARKLVELQPAFVYVTHEGEMHPDHRACARLVRRALAEAAPPVDQVRTYEVWTPMASMAHIEDVTDVIETKVRAVQAYESQCAIMRFDDAVIGLNRYRGEMHSWPGGDYAEVFGSLTAGSRP